MSCFDSYQISLIYEATNGQISEFDQFGSSIYNLTVCDSETDIDCDDLPNLEQLQVNKILSVTKNGSNLIFDMYVQLPLIHVDTRQCILKAIEHFTMDDIIETLYIDLSSANVSIRNAVDDLYVLLDVLSNVVNDCNAFELALTNIITKANELKGLLILEIGYDDEIEHIDELIEYVNSVILSIPAPSVDKYQTLDFCITALNDNLIHDFRVSPLEPYILC